MCGNEPFTSPFYTHTKDVSHDSSMHEARRGKHMSALVNMDEAETDADKEGEGGGQLTDKEGRLVGADRGKK